MTSKEGTTETWVAKFCELMDWFIGLPKVHGDNLMNTHLKGLAANYLAVKLGIFDETEPGETLDPLDREPPYRHGDWECDQPERSGSQQIREWRLARMKHWKRKAEQHGMFKTAPYSPEVTPDKVQRYCDCLESIIYRAHDWNTCQVSLGHADRRKAESQRREKELELRADVVGPVSMKLTDFFEDSLTRTKGQVRASTLRETEKVMNDFVKCVGDIDVQDVRYEHGERFIRYCFDHKACAATVAKKVRHLKRVFQLAEDRGQLDRHPLRRLKQPKAPKRKVRVFTDAQCSALCRAARQYGESRSPVKWELRVRMALDTGMRRGELMNTTWRDIDFASQTVEVSPKKDRNETWEWHIKDTDRRTLPLTGDLVGMLVEHQASQPEGCPYVFIPVSRYEHIQERRKAGNWTVEDGRAPLDNFCDHFDRIRALASIGEGTFHDLRRTCLSNWLAQGLSEFEVMRLAGHAKFETTRQFYLAVRPDAINRARMASEASRKGISVAHPL